MGRIPTRLREVRVELDDLHVLIHLLDHGSLRGAAQKLGVSRSALRRQLERLERTFGTPLVIRDGRGMQLTPAGELAASRARPLICEVGTLVDQVRAAAGQASGVIRLLIPLGLPPGPRVAALHLLASRYPDLAIDVREVPDPLRWTHLPFDVMVHLGPPPEGLDLVSSVVARSERVLLASRAYLEQHGAPSSVAALADHRVVVWRCPGRPEDQLPRTNGGWVPVQPWVISSNMGLVLEVASQGLGLAFAPALTAGDLPLEAVLQGEVGDTVTLRLSSLRPSRVDPQVAALLDNLQQILADLEGLSSKG